MNIKKIDAGYLYAFFAYFFWGFFPIYWKFLKHVPLIQTLAHRVLWAFVFYTVFIWIKNKKISFYKPTTFKIFFWTALGAILLMCNWILYIYAVNSNQIVEGSLGYFINPMINILFGVFLLNEKLSKIQIIASVTAALGVCIIAFSQGHIPWIALVLALTFSAYGLIKKTSPVASLQSNQFESLIFAGPAVIFLLWDSYEWVATSSLVPTVFLLIGTGVVTGLPLMFFAEAAKRIPYYMMGFFQFLAPTLQFLCGVLIFHEPLTHTKLIGFGFIWAAAMILAVGTYWKNKFHKEKI
jgi:chloramphenicol-sensitive protein RarD